MRPGFYPNWLGGFTSHQIISKVFSSFKNLLIPPYDSIFFLKSLFAQHYTKLSLERTGKGRDTKEASYVGK